MVESVALLAGRQHLNPFSCMLLQSVPKGFPLQVLPVGDVRFVVITRPECPLFLTWGKTNVAFFLGWDNNEKFVAATSSDQLTPEIADW